MNVHHLKLFCYVAKHGGISAAVRHIPYGIQQPAVSGQMRQLEGDVGEKLFAYVRVLPVAWAKLAVAVCDRRD